LFRRSPNRNSLTESSHGIGDPMKRCLCPVGVPQPERAVVAGEVLFDERAHLAHAGHFSAAKRGLIT